MLINPDKVKAKAKSKENEKYAFRTYLKMHADPLKLDHGYIVVLSKNYNREQEEDYIDLIPILKNLLIEPNAFLEPIKEVKVRYA